MGADLAGANPHGRTHHGQCNWGGGGIGSSTASPVPDWDGVLICGGVGRKERLQEVGKLAMPPNLASLLAEMDIIANVFLVVLVAGFLYI